MAFIGVVNASSFYIECSDPSIHQSLYEELRYDEPEFNHNSFSKWNGVVRLYDKRNCTFPSGLLHMVVKILKLYDEPIEFDPIIKSFIRNISLDDIKEWAKNLNLSSDGVKIEPYDYQLDILYTSMSSSRFLGLAATSAGKSLAQYMCSRFWLDLMGDDARILIVVPTIQLTKQLYLDFEDYSKLNGWSASENIHVAGDGVSPYSRKKITICTWQTLVKQEREFFEKFNFLMGDEAHTFSSESLKFISKSCINCYQRMGLTGTLKRNDESHKMRVSQIFGPVKVIIRAKELQDRGLATKLKINILRISYPIEVRKQIFKENDYKKELEFLINCKERNELFIKYAKVLKGNMLFMFYRIDDHMMKLKEMFEEAGFKPLIVNGSVSAEERVEVKNFTEANDKVVILGSYDTMSTGVSIKNLHHLIFCYPRKTNIKIQQSMGRLMRLHMSKEFAYVHDFIDDIRYCGKNNKAYDWGLERIDIYTDEGQPIIFNDMKFQTTSQTNSLLLLSDDQ